MSSNLETHFVVTYDHTSGEFYVDENTASSRFTHDTWDDDLGEWVYLDKVQDVPEDLSELSKRLTHLIRKDGE